MTRHNFFKMQDGKRPSADQLSDTKLFYQNAGSIISRFEGWKSLDKFYYIPLHMQMVYGGPGWAAEVAPDPVWLGSFVRCCIERPELFSFACPKCGKSLFPYRYNGSPLSGRVDLEGRCDCGWDSYVMVSGWRIRAEALRDTIKEDNLRHLKCKILPGSKESSVADLLEFLKEQ